jgi:putative metallopeptidase
MLPLALSEPARFEAEESFVPATDLWPWITRTFLDEESPLHNPTHAHLRFARVGILWTNVGNRRQMRQIIGQAEIPQAKGGKWAKARHDAQLRDWFGSVPDFVITLSAPYAAAAEPASYCALVEHELLHCAQARDAFGGLKFSRETGAPIFAIRGHDVEEFTDIVARYGAQAAGESVVAMVAAANRPPLIAAASIAGGCGTCLARAA